MISSELKSVSRFLALALAVLIPLVLGAQDSAKPASKAAVSDAPASKWDIFAGYSYLSPSGKVTVSSTVCGKSCGRDPATFSYDEQIVGGVFSVTRYLNPFVGIQAEIGVHEYNGGTYGQGGDDDGFATGAVGLILRHPSNNITPFIHALVGGAEVSGPYHNPNTMGLDLTLGGGLDYETHYFNHHLALRLIQADYEYMNPNFGLVNGYPDGGSVGINAIRLSGGFVFHEGAFPPPVPVTLAVSVNPASVFPGESVTATATAGNLNPKLNAVYIWSGKSLTGNGPTASIATADLAPGSYTVQALVKEGKPGKEGLKPWETADASATFTVKQFEPPTITCTVGPSIIKPGESATLTAVGVSPQNRPLTYSYTASVGSITPNGNTATYSSVGAPTGAVSFTCTVTDDKGQSATVAISATGTHGLTITAPYVPPAPVVSTLCAISFAKDKQRPTRVNNEAKACLDEIALDLQKQTDAKAIIVGESNAKEKAKIEKDQKLAKHNKHLVVEDPAAQRAVNTKDYLVKEKGIDASRISVSTGTTDDQSVEDYLVPAGATFSVSVTPVDEGAVKVQVRKPLPVAHKKPAAGKGKKPTAMTAK
ncbi:MAG: hypothetical protein WAN35_11750 [Terracidiphilus sp.]